MDRSVGVKTLARRPIQALELRRINENTLPARRTTEQPVAVQVPAGRMAAIRNPDGTMEHRQGRVVFVYPDEELEFIPQQQGG